MSVLRDQQTKVLYVPYTAETFGSGYMHMRSCDSQDHSTISGFHAVGSAIAQMLKYARLFDLHMTASDMLLCRVGCKSSASIRVAARL